MELLPGSTLVDGGLTRAEAADLAAGLAYAHRLGVVHRDLKPANILRASDGTPKIADFGIASAVGETKLTAAGTVLGTLRYLSPEQASGEPAGPPADVYSLAVVLDELLAERTPAIDCCSSGAVDRTRRAARRRRSSRRPLPPNSGRPTRRSPRRGFSRRARDAEAAAVRRWPPRCCSSRSR